MTDRSEDAAMVSGENPERPPVAHETAASSGPTVIRRITWRQHFAWLDHNWQAGMHVSIVVKTGGGKSYLVRHGLLPLWAAYRTLIFDVKGDDPTLAGLGIPVQGYPDAERGDGEPPAGDRTYRLMVPEWEFDPSKRDTDGMRRARRVAGVALDAAYKAGDWLIVLDETQPFVDSQNAFGLGLQGVIRNIWQRGRSRGVTLIACTQEPVWMPSPFYSQPQLVYIGTEVDPGNDHLRDLGGDRKAIAAGIAALREHEFLCIKRWYPREMWIVKVGR